MVYIAHFWRVNFETSNRQPCASGSRGLTLSCTCEQSCTAFLAPPWHPEFGDLKVDCSWKALSVVSANVFAED
jgi:hypothetical protein